MKNSEFQQWLKQFPDDTEIAVVSGRNGYPFMGTEYHDYDFCDYTNNNFVEQNDERFGKKILYIGIDG